MFGADGMMSGSAGCNNYTGGYTVDGSNIKIGPLASTRKLCSTPEGVMEQEAQFLAALETAATYRIDGDRMEMRTTDDALAATFIRAK
jgi:heat shock protein HslJ